MDRIVGDCGLSLIFNFKCIIFLKFIGGPCVEKAPDREHNWMTNHKMESSAYKLDDSDSSISSPGFMRQNLEPVVQSLTNKYVEASQIAASQLEKVCY